MRFCAVSPSGVQYAISILSAPDDHLAAGPDCGLILPPGWRVGCADNDPAVRSRIVSPARVDVEDAVTAAPDDHLLASPNYRVLRPRARLIDIANGGPGISAGIISTTGI